MQAGLEAQDASSGQWNGVRGLNGALQTYLSSLLAGEDTVLGRLLTTNGVKWTTVQNTAGGASTLIKSGKTALFGIIGVTAGTSYVLTPRDNATASAGGTSFPQGFTCAVGNITDAVLKGSAPIFDTGLVIDAAGTPGSYYVLYA